MSKKQYVALMVLVLVSGFLGGALSSWLFQGQAQAQARTKKIISAEEFHLVNSKGKLVAKWNTSLGWPGLRFYDQEEKIHITLGMPMGMPSLSMFDGEKPRMLRGLNTKKQPRFTVLDANQNQVWNLPGTGRASIGRNTLGVYKIPGGVSRPGKKKKSTVRKAGPSKPRKQGPIGK